MTITINTKYNKGDVVYLLDCVDKKIIKAKIKDVYCVTQDKDDSYVAYTLNKRNYGCMNEDALYDNEEIAYSILIERINQENIRHQIEIDNNNKILKKL